ncbi:sigma-70 family RNA polymerase sigma factor [Salinicoccus sp. CNSTN-B1]
MISITRNSVIDLSRRKKLDTFEYDERDDANQSDHFNSSVEQQAQKHAEQEMISEAMQSLNDEQKIIINLFYFKAYSQSQIAKSLDLPLGTVKGRIRLALGHLKKNIDLARKGGTQSE